MNTCLQLPAHLPLVVFERGWTVTSGALKSPRSRNGLLVPSKSLGGGMKESRVPREEVSSLLHSLQSNEVVFRLETIQTVKCQCFHRNRHPRLKKYSLFKGTIHRLCLQNFGILSLPPNSCSLMENRAILQCGCHLWIFSSILVLRD